MIEKIIIRGGYIEGRVRPKLPFPYVFENCVYIWNYKLSFTRYLSPSINLKIPGISKMDRSIITPPTVM